MKNYQMKNGFGYNMSLFSLFGSGPKWTLQCGKCSKWFRERIQMVDYPQVVCPHCGTLQEVPVEVE